MSDLTIPPFSPAQQDTHPPSRPPFHHSSSSTDSKANAQTQDASSKALQGVASSIQSKSGLRKKRSMTKLTTVSTPVSASSSSSSTSSSSSASSKQPPAVDLTRVFYSTLVMSSEGKQRILFVPVSQLPEPLKNQFLAKETLIEESTDPKERLKIWKEVFGPTYGTSTPIYEVTNVSRNEIRGIKSRIDVYRMLGGKTLETFLLENSKLNATEKTVVSSRQEAHLKAKAAHGAKTYIFSAEESLEIMAGTSMSDQAKKLTQKGKVIFQMNEFKNSIASLINSFGGRLCPKESMRLLWDMLSQAILREQPFQDTDKALLSQRLLEYWEDVNWSILNTLNYSHIQDLSNAELSLNEAIEKLRNVKKAFQIDSIDGISSFQINLQEICAPLLHLLKWSKKLNPNEIQALAQELLAFFNRGLDETCHLTIYMDQSRRLMREWLESHSSLLERYLVMHSANSQLQGFLERTQHINRAFKNQNWLEAYQEMQTLINDLIPFSKPTNIIVGANNQGVYAPSRDEYISIRFLHLSREVLVNFRSFIADDNMYQVISEEAFSEIKKSYKTMQVALTDKTKMGATLFEWANRLRKENYPELYTAMKEMKTHWDSLKAAKANLLQTAKLNQLLEFLFQAIEKEDYRYVAEVYLEIYKLISGPMKDWTEALQQINQSIAIMQDISLLMLMDPSLPAIEVQAQRDEFLQFNERLRELIQPTTCFYNAFQQLICLDHPNSQKLRDSSDGISLRFTGEGAFRLTLFQTGPHLFESLAAQIAQIHQQSHGPMTLEIEEEDDDIQVTKDESIRLQEEAPQPPPTKPAVQRDELAADVAEVFQSSTKTRVIKRNLTDFLDRLNAKYSQKFGKGDHNKFYVNGVMIVLPKHAEWAPGTLKSIQNQVLEQLRGIVSTSNS